MEGATVFHIYLAEDYKPRVSEKTGLDLSGFKMRSTAGYHPMFKKMGAVPINISPGDVYTSLERGVVKGLAWPEGGVARYGWSKFIKYRIGPGWWRTSSTIVMNLDAYKKLSQKHRDALEKASLAYEDRSRETLRKLVLIDNQKVFASGVKHVDLKGKAATAYLDVAYNATWDAAKKRMPAETYNKLRKLLLK
jgi:TRAP-type C4-dicarboxylate transport system substrate-binding protein